MVICAAVVKNAVTIRAAGSRTPAGMALCSAHSTRLLSRIIASVAPAMPSAASTLLVMATAGVSPSSRITSGFCTAAFLA